ncbi:unnamed protein product [Fraxinus pennsylvanica]|uniref:Uncharacterized protein n=1 Tax=Fraxinus pennsylvanica TaxID=56036 RepID=A0AAD1Z365_9LAMI|nr:unnamed protein product [Fraxinus pennsylvanica]
MGSTGEADRKRRHISSISPTAATVKKHPFVPISEDKKHLCQELNLADQFDFRVCNFDEEEPEKEVEPLESATSNTAEDSSSEPQNQTNYTPVCIGPEVDLIPAIPKEEAGTNLFNMYSDDKNKVDAGGACTQKVGKCVLRSKKITLDI